MSAGGVLCDPPREFLVIQSSFGQNVIRGYFPKDRLAELGIEWRDGGTWFSKEQSEAMHAHPEWIAAEDWK